MHLALGEDGHEDEEVPSDPEEEGGAVHREGGHRLVVGWVVLLVVVMVVVLEVVLEVVDEVKQVLVVVLWCHDVSLESCECFGDGSVDTELFVFFTHRAVGTTRVITSVFHWKALASSE